MMPATEDRRINRQGFARVHATSNPANADRNAQSLDDLAQSVRRLVPLPSSISRLEVNQESGYVDLTWQSRQFVIKPSLEVFELKGKTLFVNGASILIQTGLTRQESMNKIVKAIDNVLARVEDLFKTRRQEAAYSLLASVKATVTRQAGVKSTPALYPRASKVLTYSV